MKKGMVSLLLAGLMLTVTACGSSSSASSADTNYAAKASAPAAAESFGYEDAEPMEAAAEEAYIDEGGDFSQNESAAPESVEQGDPKKSSRKLITTVGIDAESDDVEALVDRIEHKVEALGGYVENGNVYSDNNRYGGEASKSADITARVPAEKLNEFLNDVEGNSNIVGRSVNTQDVTLQYADTEAHERALTLEQQSLERMLGMAETVEDIMAIQSQLTDVRYRLDSIRSQLRTYDNDVNYATVHISITETKKFTVTEEETVLDRIRNGFVDNLMDVMDALTEFIVWLITHIPTLILLGVILFVIILAIRRIAKTDRRQKKKPEPKEKQAPEDKKDGEKQ